MKSFYIFIYQEINVGERGHFLGCLFLSLSSRGKEVMKPTSASRSTHTQEILAVLWGGCKCCNIASAALTHPVCCRLALAQPLPSLGLSAGAQGHCQHCPPAPCGTGGPVTFSLCCRHPPVPSQTAFVPALLPCQGFPSLWGKSVV